MRSWRMLESVRADKARQALANQVRTGLVGIARRVDGRNADQVLRERNDLIALGVNALQQAV